MLLNKPCSETGLNYSSLWTCGEFVKCVHCLCVASWDWKVILGKGSCYRSWQFYFLFCVIFWPCVKMAWRKWKVSDRMYIILAAVFFLHLFQSHVLFCSVLFLRAGLLWTHVLRPIALAHEGRSLVNDVFECRRDWTVRRGWVGMSSFVRYLITHPFQAWPTVWLRPDWLMPVIQRQSTSQPNLTAFS